MAVKKKPTNPGFTAAFTPQAAKAIAKVKRKADSQKAQDVSNAMGNIPIPEISTGAETVAPVAPINAATPDQKQSEKGTPVDSRKVLKAYLTQYKLEGLSEQTYNMLAENQITAETPIDVIGELLKDTDVYKTRFSGNVTREAKDRKSVV